MKLASIQFLVILLLVIFNFDSSNAQEENQEVPFVLESPYFENWVSGIKEGGSGFIIYLPIKKDRNIEVTLDEVYFKNERIKLELHNNDSVYIGKHTNSDFLAKKKHIQNAQKKTSFNLKGNQCMIIYTYQNKTKYLKLDRLPEKVNFRVPM